MLAAAKLNHAECMSALMAANGEDDSPFDDSECIGLTPLMVSAAFGSFEVRHLPTHSLLNRIHYNGFCGIPVHKHSLMWS